LIRKPTIAVTMGDPAGVGPEVILGALADPAVKRAARVLAVGDERVFTRVAKRAGLSVPRSLEIINPLPNLAPNGAALGPGRLGKEWARAVPVYIETAVKMALSGEADAIATAPINKSALKNIGFKYPGHTEFIAELTKTKDYVMMLGGDRLKVVLVTIHEPLSRVPKLVTTDNVYKTIKITDEAFRIDFGLKRPRMGVAGLNPHAGEGGIFGDEEERVIMPAIRKARRLGIRASDPIAPDTIFLRAARGEFDCVIAMYHDQGLGPLKLIHFEDAINATLGLPIIRTSVDHGTAYEIAWQGRADHRSMSQAIIIAAGMARARRGVK
jgi:4-hydroxythreonine-4-phosphate dehydrogenase